MKRTVVKRMQTQPFHDTWSRQWSMLLIYNIYRLVNIVVLFCLFFLGAYNHINGVLYCGALFIYLMFGLLFLYIWHVRSLKFKQQVMWSGTIDTIVMVLFIYSIGYIQSGLGILLSAPIAMLSILVPGRLSIFFAAVASCMLLAISIFQYEYGGQQSANTFFSTGMYGAFFFATALTAWYFVHWIRMSERLARHRGKELESMQRLNEYIVGRLQYGVIFVDAGMQIKVINKAARQFFHHEHTESDLTLRELNLALYQKYTQFLAKKKLNGLTAAKTILDKPYLQVHFLPTSAAALPAVLIIINDMAVIAQQVQQLKLAALGRFSASIAHELRNPLGIILHAVQLMDEGHRLNDEDQRLNQMIVNNCKRMNTVIQNVLHVSRRKQVKPQSIELTPFLKQFKHEFCLINPCEIILNIPQNKRKTIIFDKGQLEQILVIICDNAMQHGCNKRGEVHITISVKHQGKRLILTLCDTGPGIAAELRNEVFEPFFSTVITGNGMGLFIAKDLCEINQTRLNIIDTVQGCCFAITFSQNDEMEL